MGAHYIWEIKDAIEGVNEVLYLAQDWRVDKIERLVRVVDRFLVEVKVLFGTVGEIDPVLAPYETLVVAESDFSIQVAILAVEDPFAI